MGDTIENAVQMALGGVPPAGGAAAATTDPGTPLSPALEGAYALGRGEARSGRSADALLSAYRVGARVAWRELAETAVRGGRRRPTCWRRFAELVFAYIDELSAASRRRARRRAGDHRPRAPALPRPARARAARAATRPTP